MLSEMLVVIIVLSEKLYLTCGSLREVVRIETLSSESWR